MGRNDKDFIFSRLESGYKLDDFFMPDEPVLGSVHSQNNISDIEDKVEFYFSILKSKFPKFSGNDCQVILRDLCPYFVVEDDPPRGKEKYGIVDPIALVTFNDILSEKRGLIADKYRFMRDFDFDFVERIVENMTDLFRKSHDKFLSSYILDDEAIFNFSPCYKNFDLKKMGVIDDFTPHDVSIWRAKIMQAFFARKKNNHYIKNHVANQADRFARLIYGNRKENSDIRYSELNPVEQAVVSIYAVGDWMSFGFPKWLNEKDCSINPKCDVCKDIQKPYLTSGQQTVLLELVPGGMDLQELVDFYGGVTLKVIPGNSIQTEEMYIQSWELKHELDYKINNGGYEKFAKSVREQFQELQDKRRYLIIDRHLKEKI
ncbi:hypothetical protein JXM83_01430 [Candidatus Woesearchaeota archaeon]|nr:hypothetical protein [Candidatus Woesearchaeota archaeon]